MNLQQKKIAKQCKQGAEDNTMDFPSIVKQLSQAGFERYLVDFNKSTIIYYLPSGENLTLRASRDKSFIAERLDAATVQIAIREAQEKVEGFSYKGFCKKVMDAGCAGYLVSFLGKRVLYFGRTGEIHVEHFPD